MHFRFMNPSFVDSTVSQGWHRIEETPNAARSRLFWGRHLDRHPPHSSGNPPAASRANAWSSPAARRAAIAQPV